MLFKVLVLVILVSGSSVKLRLSISVICMLQAARALANLAAHGDSNGNNAAVGKEPGALEALVHLTSSNHEGVR